MILWTIQTELAWSRLQSEGVLWPYREQLTEEEWLQPYEWMIAQMKTRLGPPPEKGCFPIWAWYQWDGEHRRRPDLRASGHLPVGERGVRIELECREDEVLLSDFELWHYVLNYWYLPQSVQEGKAFEAELAAKGLALDRRSLAPWPVHHMRIVKSWERIFDLGWAKPGIASPMR